MVPRTLHHLNHKKEAEPRDDETAELVSVDLEGMWLSISNEQHTEKDCAKHTVGIAGTVPFRASARNVPRHRTGI
jgi:hypothetical protein